MMDKQSLANAMRALSDDIEAMVGRVYKLSEHVGNLIVASDLTHVSTDELLAEVGRRARDANASRAVVKKAPPSKDFTFLGKYIQSLKEAGISQVEQAKGLGIGNRTLSDIKIGSYLAEAVDDAFAHCLYNYYNLSNLGISFDEFRDTLKKDAKWKREGKRRKRKIKPLSRLINSNKRMAERRAV